MAACAMSCDSRYVGPLEYARLFVEHPGTSTDVRGLTMNCRPLAILLLLSPTLAGAELKQSAADGAFIEHRFQIAATPAVAWQTLVHPERWWPADHTWSGAATNLSLAPEAGGCFCERWDGGSAEHARVAMARPGELLRMRGSLGPLQEMALTGVLTVALAAKGDGTEAVVTYRLSGDASHKLDGFVAVVDQVIGLQFGSFAKAVK
jgi:uncharacterized protein YndB with AHSA1/START domain